MSTYCVNIQLLSTSLLRFGWQNCCRQIWLPYFKVTLIPPAPYSIKYSLDHRVIRKITGLLLGCGAHFHFHPQGCSKRLPAFFASTLCIIYNHNSSSEHFNFAPRPALALMREKWRKTFLWEAFMLLASLNCNFFRNICRNCCLKGICWCVH